MVHGACLFKDSWLKDDRFKHWLQKCSEKHKAKCRVCLSEFQVKDKGVGACIAHSNSVLHKKNLKESGRDLKTMFSAMKKKSLPTNPIAVDSDTTAPADTNTQCHVITPDVNNDPFPPPQSDETAVTAPPKKKCLFLN